MKRIIAVNTGEKRIEQRTTRKRNNATPAAAAGGGTH